MKKTFFAKITSAVLALSVCGAALVSCGGQTETVTDTAGEASTAPVVESTVFPYIETGLEYETLDFQGKTVTYLYRGADSDSRHKYETYKDPVNDPDYDPNDKIDSAVFAKNEAVKAALHIEFDFVAANGAAHGMGALGVLEYLNKAEAGQYQIVSNSNLGLASKVMTGAFLNLRQLPYTDFTKAYWSQGICESATIFDAMFNVTGSISLYLYDSLFVTFVNKKLCVDHDIDPATLYQCVLDKKWTLDYVIDLTSEIYEDKNKDGDANVGDVFGYALQITSSTEAFWSACDIRLSGRTDEGKVTYDPDIGKLNTVVTKLHRFAWNSPGVIRIVEDSDFQNESKGLYASIGSEQIGKDQALFSNDRLYEVKNEYMRECTYYGILPYPKYNDKQKQYYSFVHDSYTSIVVPIDAVADSEVIGATLESLAEKSHNTVMPVYYEEVLTTRYAKDPDSVRMLNIIFLNIKLDTAQILGSGGLSANLLTYLVMNSALKSVRTACAEQKNSAENYCEQYTKVFKQYKNNDRK